MVILVVREVAVVVVIVVVVCCCSIGCSSHCVLQQYTIKQSAQACRFYIIQSADFRLKSHFV